MVPVKKKSKMRRRTRRAHDGIPRVHLMSCPQCGQAKPPHHACRNCGHVNAHTSIKTDE